MIHGFILSAYYLTRFALWSNGRSKRGILNSECGMGNEKELIFIPNSAFRWFFLRLGGDGICLKRSPEPNGFRAERSSSHALGVTLLKARRAGLFSIPHLA
jgi:hypothetical protein